MKDFAVILQSAVVPYRVRDGRVEVMLITSLQTSRWIVPKGHLEPDMSVRESAAKEAYEEAGLEGTVGHRPIGVYDYVKSDEENQKVRRVEVFLMEVSRILDDWPEKHLRDRKWMLQENAAAAVLEPDLKKIIAGFSPLQTRP